MTMAANMIAIDTNIVVRFLVRDDEAQWARVCALIRDRAVYVPASVVLETAWVLRSVHGYSRLELCEGLEQFFGLPNVSVETPERFAFTFDWVRKGLDFADALHLAASEGCESLLTFDRAFAQRSRGAVPKVAKL